MATILTLHHGGGHPGGGGRPPTGEELLSEAAHLFVDYLRVNLPRLPVDDPERPRIEALEALASGEAVE